MKYATVVQVRHDAERTPPPLGVVESHPSHIKVHKPNVSRDLGVWWVQCPLGQCPLDVLLMVDFRITQISVGGETQIKTRFGREYCKKGLRIFFLKSLFCEKKVEGQFFGNFQ